MGGKDLRKRGKASIPQETLTPNAIRNIHMYVPAKGREAWLVPAKQAKLLGGICHRTTGGICIRRSLHPARD